MAFAAMLSKSLASLSKAGASLFPKEATTEDRAETVYIRPLALLKMLEQARRGVPFEVMGICVGTMVDGYSVEVADVFHMPLLASTVAVEAQDHGYQVEMKALLEETGRTEDFVGWYHSHPGYGCWLSKTDQETQANFQQIQPRAVALVLDPVQSVRGRVVLDAFRVNDAKGHDSLLAFLMPTQKHNRHVTSFHGLASAKGPDHSKQIAKGLSNNYYKLNVVVTPAPGLEPAVLRHLSRAVRKSAHSVAFSTRPDLLATRQALEPAKELAEMAKLTKALTRRVLSAVNKPKPFTALEKASAKAKSPSSAAAATAAREEEEKEEFGQVDARSRLIGVSTRLSELTLLSALNTRIYAAALAIPQGEGPPTTPSSHLKA